MTPDLMNEIRIKIDPFLREMEKKYNVKIITWSSDINKCMVIADEESKTAGLT